MTEQKDQKKDTDQKGSPAKKKPPKGKSKKKDKANTKEITQLKEQIASEKDRVLRLSAEFDNYQKRKQRELDEFKKFANEIIFKQLLTVVDNLERAISSSQENSDKKTLIEGVELTYKEIIKLFETFNVKPVEAENKTFDPNFHQAVTQEETDKIPDNTVTKVLQKGYLLHDRLIRPAMVIVSKKRQKNKTDKKENKKN
ncbi:MAG: nucleotide exchange factor GrpE [Deltaproteobacteria bacterium]|nr:nucleotide exchange factor GrpE [Deltaproteobacteria bacterium]